MGHTPGAVSFFRPFLTPATAAAGVFLPPDLPWTFRF